MIESNKKKRNDHIRNDPTTLTLSITSVVCCVVQYLLWECVCVCVCVCVWKVSVCLKVHMLRKKEES